MTTKLLKESQVKFAENIPIARTAAVLSGEAINGVTPETIHESRSVVRPNGARLQANTDMWNRFWDKHGNEDGLFDRLLWPIRRLFSARHAKLLMRYMHRYSAPNGKTAMVLEVGCGSAATSSIIAKTVIGTSIFGVDLSKAAIKVARARNPRFHGVVADAMDLPFAGEKFSLAFSSGVIEHFDRSIADQMHAEHCRVTRNDGTVGLIVPWKHSPYNLLRILSGSRWPFGHENPFSIRELGRFTGNHSVSGVEVKVSYGTTLTGIGRRHDALDRQIRDADPIGEEELLEYSV